LRDDIVARAAIVDGDGDSGNSIAIGHRGKSQFAGGVRIGVTDRRIGNQTRVAGNRSDSQCLIFIGRTGRDAG